ncbi:MAG: nickel-dependent hydrogenase large subunit [Bacillota bacterium]
MARLVVDPVTRIEGRLRIEARLDGGQVREAFSSGTMVRALEIVLRGRDPREAWALAQRICGVCTTVHALASVRAVEAALGIGIPPNANLIRNIMSATQMIQDHVIHFYHLHALDWVDITAALQADPAETSALARRISRWPRSSAGYFKDVRERLKRFAASGQLGIFAGGYWGHPAYRLPPEVNLLAVAHYLEALNWQAQIIQIHALFGGKNPHPNYLVGGMPVVLGREAAGAVGWRELEQVERCIREAQEFVEAVYLPDLFAIAGYYAADRWGAGPGHFLSFGEFPATETLDPAGLRIPRGAVLDGNLGRVEPVDLTDPEAITESVARAWYRADPVADGLHPWQGRTELAYEGPLLSHDGLNTEGKYSWLKAPRWKARPMEVGPLARLVVAYARGHPEVREEVDEALARLGLSQPALFSTLGRTLARGLETRLVARWLAEFFEALVANVRRGETKTVHAAHWDPKTWPAEARGIGFAEAPRGALGHWIRIEAGRIANYQVIAPTTWNASPRDASGQPGPLESALVGTPVALPDQPLELLRTVHSFDPCIACAVHVADASASAKRRKAAPASPRA